MTGEQPIEVAGFCDPAFAAVRKAFEDNFERGEIGASCCVRIEGQAVVDLWGGWADDARTRPWRENTLVNVYSVGKPIAAVGLLRCIAAGEVDLDESATNRWPELLAGKRGATVRQLLCHRAGLPAIRTRLTNEALWDWDVMCEALAATEPWWEPGSKHGYHTNTYGFLVGEMTRRVTGRSPGEWLREEIVGPLGADMAWGLTPEEQKRCAEVVWQSDVTPPPEWLDPSALDEERAMIVLSYVNPPGIASLGVVNTRRWRETQVPSTNMHANARGIARVYSAFAAGGSIDGVEVLDAAVLREATKPQSEGWCPFLEREVTFGLGFQPTRPDRPFGPNAGSFGHYGAGGALGFADPEANLAFGYAMNAVKPRWQNDRNRALVDAVYDSL